jgi:hypothetical protein
MSIQSTYGYTYPTYLLNNNQIISSNNPLPVLLGGGLSATAPLGSVNLLSGLYNGIVTSNNPLPVILVAAPAVGGALQSLGSVGLIGCNNQLISVGNPLPVSLSAAQSVNVTFSSNITISQTVTVTSSAADPVHIHLEQQLPSGSNTIGGVYLTNTSNGGVISTANPLAVSLNTATVNVSNLPSTNLIGAVNVWNAGAAITSAAPLSVTLNSTTVAVSNLAGSNMIGSVYLSGASNYIGSVSISSAANLNVVNLAGSNMMGSVFLSGASNLIGSVYLSGGSNYIGAVSISSAANLNVVTQATSNLIGSVYLSGTSNLIGSVYLSGGSNYIGAVSISSAANLNTVAQATSNLIGSVYLSGGSNLIGSVYLSGGSNYIGAVSISSAANLNVINLAGSNTIGGVYLMNTSNGGVISSNNPLMVQLVGGSGGTSNNVNVQTGGQNITNTNPLVVSPTNMQLDAFGRMRFSTPFTLADYKNQYLIDPNLCFIGSNGGFSNFSKYQAAAVLSNTIQNGATSILQSYMYHNYQPGKSQLVLQSYNFNGYTCNVTKRIGYFDDNDGIYLELSGSNSGAGALSINIRSSVGYPTIATQQAVQGSWNMDNMNGGASGPNPSGVNLNMSNVQLFFTDFQWLGVGRVRCGFVISGQMIDCHEFNCANITSNIYMTTGSLPIRAEMRNIATLSAPTTMNKLCSTVICEGGYQESGLDFSYTTNFMSGTNVAGNDVNHPVFSLKLAPIYNGYPNHVYLKLTGISIYTTASSVVYNIVKVNSSNLVSGGSWYNIGDGSASMFSSNMSSFTGSSANCLSSGFALATTGGNAYNFPIQNSIIATTKRNLISNNIQGTDSQTYVVLISNKTNTATSVDVSLQWQEIY